MPRRFSSLLAHRAVAPIAVAALALSGLAGGPAEAADFSVGLGLGADHGRTECRSAYPCDHSSGYAKVTASYRFDPAFDLQAIYFDAGKLKGADTTPLGTDFGGTFEVSGFGLTAGYRLDLAPGWDLALRAGAAGVRTRFAYAAPFDGSAAKTRLQPLGGVGVGYAITPALRLSLDYDITRFKVHATHGPLQMLGIAAQYSF